MLRKLRICLGLLLAVAACDRAMAFSIWGPLISWQTQDLGLGPTYGELGGPHNLGEEWRLNTGVITYGFDPSFLDYFGTDGVKAIDAAFAVMNSLPAVSKMSADLSEFPTQGAIRVNQRAQALYLLDVKSVMLSLLVEHMGLAGETHVFDLRQRIVPPGGPWPACYYEYTIINWNFDPITFEPTHYVNGVQYSYVIVDDCPTRAEAMAYEFPVDKTEFPYSAVSTLDGLVLVGNGAYYMGLTRDDVGGLRYLYSRGNPNNEVLADGTPAGSGSLNSSWGVPTFWGTNLANGNGQTGQTTASTNTSAIYGGVEKINFVKMNSVGLIGTNYRSATLSYTIPSFVNTKWTDLKVRRTVNQPDILITAADLGPRTPDQTTEPPIVTRSYGQAGGTTGTTQTTGNQNGGNGGTAGIIAGPGVFVPQMLVTFNKLGPYYFVEGVGNNYFLNEQNSSFGWVWGSFDGSTNAPVVYPKGSSIQEWEKKVLGAQLSFNQTSGDISGVFNPVLGVATNTATGNATGGGQ